MIYFKIASAFITKIEAVSKSRPRNDEHFVMITKLQGIGVLVIARLANKNTTIFTFVRASRSKLNIGTMFLFNKKRKINDTLCFALGKLATEVLL